MAWDTITSGYYAGRPIIYNYSGGSYTPARTGSGDYLYFTWQSDVLWDAHEEAIKFINDTENPMTMSSISIKTCACHSGGSTFWSSTSDGAGPSWGYGADYTCYVRVSNDDEASFQESDRFTNDIPSLTSSNMNSRGSSTTHTAVFGDPPFTGIAGFQLREYTITNCPEIQPGGVAYIHMDIGNFKGPDTYIRFSLDPREMEVYFEPDVDPYIWVYESDHKWHLRQPFYVTSGGKWTSVEKL